MPAKRDILAEIEELRGRTTELDDLDSGILKLLTITVSTEKLKDDGQEDELHAYFVVASIAAIETYFSVADSQADRFWQRTIFEQHSAG